MLSDTYMYEEVHKENRNFPVDVVTNTITETSFWSNPKADLFSREQLAKLE